MPKPLEDINLVIIRPYRPPVTYSILSAESIFLPARSSETKCAAYLTVQILLRKTTRRDYSDSKGCGACTVTRRVDRKLLSLSLTLLHSLRLLQFSFKLTLLRHIISAKNSGRERHEKYALFTKEAVPSNLNIQYLETFQVQSSTSLFPAAFCFVNSILSRVVLWYSFHYRNSHSYFTRKEAVLMKIANKPYLHSEFKPTLNFIHSQNEFLCSEFFNFGNKETFSAAFTSTLLATPEPTLLETTSHLTTFSWKSGRLLGLRTYIIKATKLM